MYIVTFIQSDSNNIDSNLCSTPKELFKKAEEFFLDSLLIGFKEFKADAKSQMDSKDSVTIEVGCYTTIHIQKLNAYSREQLLLANQESPLAPQEPFKPFVVAATLPDYSQVVLGRFDTEEEQKTFERDCSIYNYEECKCAVCGEVLGEDDEVYIDQRSGQPLCDGHSRFNEEEDFYEATEGDLEHRMREVQILLEDGNSFYSSINSTKKGVEEYYAIGRVLNIGKGEHDYITAIKEIKFV